MRTLLLSFFLSACLLNSQAWAAKTDMVCESGQAMSVTGDHRVENLIQVGWRGQLYTMERVRTTTGAHRFEDARSGLIWIGIPEKAMLLDGRLGAPVVNDCKVASIAAPQR